MLLFGKAIRRENRSSFKLERLAHAARRGKARPTRPRARKAAAEPFDFYSPLAYSPATSPGFVPLAKFPVAVLLNFPRAVIPEARDKSPRVGAGAERPRGFARHQ